MPAGLIAALPLIFGGLGAATGVATGIKSLTAGGGPTGPTEPTQAQAIAAETARRAEAAGQAQNQLPGLQSATGGSVSPGYLQSMSALLSGNSDLGSSPQLQQAVSSFLGQNNVTMPNGVGGSTMPATPIGTVFPGLNVPGAASSSPAMGAATNSFMNTQQQGDNPFAAFNFG